MVLRFIEMLAVDRESNRSGPSLVVEQMYIVGNAVFI